MTNFTPGPWQVAYSYSESERSKVCWATNGPFVTAARKAQGSLIDEAESEANAHLIAAAPEMYAALKHIQKYYPRMSIFRDALAKAEGRS